MKTSRRNFIKAIGAGAAGLIAGFPLIARATAASPAEIEIVPVDLLIPGLTPAQSEVAASTERLRWVAAGRRWGKSTFVRREAEQVAQKGGRALWLVDNQLMKRNALSDLTNGWDKRVIWRYDGIVNFPSGGHIFVATYDEFLSHALFGYDWDYIAIDEAAIIENFNWDRFYQQAGPISARILVISTPLEGSEFNRLGEDTSGPFGEWGESHFQFPTETNPFIGADQIAEMRRTMSAKTFDEQINGYLIHSS